MAHRQEHFMASGIPRQFWVERKPYLVFVTDAYGIAPFAAVWQLINHGNWLHSPAANGHHIRRADKFQRKRPYFFPDSLDSCKSGKAA